MLVTNVFQTIAAQVRNQDYGKPFLSIYLLGYASKSPVQLFMSIF